MPIAIAAHQVKFDNIAAVIFDKDGTLENSLTFWREVGIRRARTIDAQIPGVGEPLLMAFGILDNALDPQGLIAVGSRRENEIAAAAYIAETGRNWHSARQIAHQAFNEVSESKYLVKTTESAPLFDDVKQTLQSLTDAGLKIGILSADSTAEVNNFVKNHGLENYISSCMGVDDELTKPDPRLFEKACVALEVTPERTIMVGDSIGDIAMAKAASAGTIGIDRYGSRLLKRADVQINNLLEIQVL